MRKKKLRVKIVGCGGVGLCLLNILPRYLHYKKEYATELTLVDGDEYEDRNRERQGFTSVGNKAAITAETIRKEFDGLLCTAVEDYLNEVNVRQHIKDGDVVFSCVDNHATRKLLNDRCQSLKNVVLFSGGNEYHDGNVQIYVKEKGQQLTEPITKNQVAIQDPVDEIPAVPQLMGCAKEQVSEPQLLITNNQVAASMLCGFLGWEEGVFSDSAKRYDEVKFDVLVNKVNPIKRS